MLNHELKHEKNAKWLIKGGKRPTTLRVPKEWKKKRKPEYPHLGRGKGTD